MGPPRSKILVEKKSAAKTMARKIGIVLVWIIGILVAIILVIFSLSAMIWVFLNILLPLILIGLLLLIPFAFMGAGGKDVDTYAHRQERKIASEQSKFAEAGRKWNEEDKQREIWRKSRKYILQKGNEAHQLPDWSKWKKGPLESPQSSLSQDRPTYFEKKKHKNVRTRIPSHVRQAVYQRDGGKCSNCGSSEDIELDHIVPVSKGGSNTTQNVEFLCRSCNRSKSDKIQ